MLSQLYLNKAVLKKKQLNVVYFILDYSYMIVFLCKNIKPYT